MEDRTYLTTCATLGGALLGALLLTVVPVFAHDWDDTHPVLTDEIVNFFNINFPDQKLTEEEKQWLVKGSIDEDAGERSLFHFYDPVYNRGRFTDFTSKDWALKEGIQDNYSNFSYTRALDEYAKGDREMSLTAFGHVLHLLEDAGTPEHTRSDPYPSVLGLRGSYQSETAKWNQQNLNKIVSKLVMRRDKPVSLPGMADYFYRVASYSNNNFFSKNTIFSVKYGNPTVDIWEYKRWPIEKVIGYKKDQFGKFPLVEKNIFSNSYTIDSSVILNSYWERLSGEVVISGAGALRLFLEEGERAKQSRLARESRKNRGFLGQLWGVFGVSDDANVKAGITNREKELATPKVVAMPEDKQPLSGVAQDVNKATNTSTPGDNKVTPKVSPSLSPSLSPHPSPEVESEAKPPVSPNVSPKISPPPVLTSTPVLKVSQLEKTGRVVINEIGWAGTEASATDEWLELYNIESKMVDISGWRLFSDDDSPNIFFPEGTIITANGYFLIERTNNNTISDLLADLTVSFGQGGLSNTGEILRLVDGVGTDIDTVGRTGESWFAGNATGKYSMERISTTAPGEEASNWKNFSGAPSNHDANNNFVNGTPKSINSPAAVTSSAGGSGGLSVSPVSTSLPQPSPSPSDTGVSVVINEIGWMGTATSSNDEWIELYNITSQTVDLTGWALSASDGTPSITLSGAISGYGFYLLERTNDLVISDISADKIYTGALGNSGEWLKLRDNSGNLKDSADFSTGWPAGDNATKSSMERINPSNSGDNSSNWGTNNGITKNGSNTGGDPINGTPKTQNSVFSNS